MVLSFDDLRQAFEIIQLADDVIRIIHHYKFNKKIANKMKQLNKSNKTKIKSAILIVCRKSPCNLRRNWSGRSTQCEEKHKFR